MTPSSLQAACHAPPAVIPGAWRVGLARAGRAAALAGCAAALLAACRDPTAGPSKLSGGPVAAPRATVQALLLKALPAPRFPANVTLGGGTVRYLGFDADPVPARRGQALTLTHYWQVLKAPGDTWRLFVHLTPPAGAQFVNADHVPLDGLDPVSAWQPGDVIPDRHTVMVPMELPGDRLDVRLGLWNDSGRMAVDDPRFDDGERRVRAGSLPLTGGSTALPTYEARRAAGPIQVDGKLDEPSWSMTPEVRLVNTMTGQPARYATRARVLWDDTYLYVGFDCDDDDVWAKPGRTHDSAIYEDDVVEVFVDADGDGRTYNELEVSPANVTFDAMFETYRSDLKKAVQWESGMKSAVQLRGTLADGGDDKGYTVELAIPLKNLAAVPRLPPKPGDRWRFNLYRIDMHNHAGVWDGAALSPPLRGDFHALDRFAWLEFGQEPSPRSSGSPK